MTVRDPVPDRVPRRTGHGTGSHDLVPDNVGQGGTRSRDDWQVRLAAAVAVHSRRRELRAVARGELDRARAYGLQARHNTKSRRVRVDRKG